MPDPISPRRTNFAVVCCVSSGMGAAILLNNCTEEDTSTARTTQGTTELSTLERSIRSEQVGVLNTRLLFLAIHAEPGSVLGWKLGSQGHRVLSYGTQSYPCSTLVLTVIMPIASLQRRCSSVALVGSARIASRPE